MKRERIGIQPGDLIRCPDRATARWHMVLRVGRRRDGSRYVSVRRSRLWRALGLAPRQVLEWSMLRDIGYGLKRGRPGTVKVEPGPLYRVEPDRPWPTPPPPPDPGA